MKPPFSLYDHSTVTLTGITVPKLPSEIVVKEQKLFIKDEFHITLLAAGYLANIINPNSQGYIKSQILQEFEKFIESTSLSVYTITNELRFAQDVSGHKTVIVLAHVQNLDTLFDQLNTKFDKQLPKQQTHVTLYRYPKDFIGIPIPSAEALEKTTRPVDLALIKNAMMSA